MKKDQLNKQDVQLLCDLVMDAMLANDGKFGPASQAFHDDLSAVQDKLWTLMDWADV